MKTKKDLYINTYKYVKVGLGYGSNRETGLDRYRKLMLCLLNDYFTSKVSLKKAAEIAHELYQLEYFSSNLTVEDPDLFAVFDILGFIALKDPKTKLMEKVKDYYLKNYSAVISDLSGDLKVRLRD